jgi:hypothetical protein
MKRGLTAALLSALVPGLGQLYNRRLIRGTVLVLGMSFFFIALAVVLFLKLSQAAATLESSQLESGVWINLARAFQDQDLTWLMVVLGLGGLAWAFGIVDAFLDGRRLAGEESP